MSTFSSHGRSVIVLGAAALMAAALPFSARAAGDVSAVRYWTAPDHTRVVVDLTGESQYSTRSLTGPDRVVVLVVGGSVASASKSTPVEDGLVDRVRLNQLESGAQVVVDLTQAAAYNVFPLKPYREKPSRIVIDVFRGSVSESAPVEGPGGNGEPRVVVIDPGHGGEDPGTLGNGKLKEKTVVFDIARELAGMLRSREGYEVHMTRTGDYFVPLAKRKRIANDGAGDIFVSIHANSAPNRKASGTEIFFVSPRGASDQAARELADRENACDMVGGVSPDASSDVISILVDLKMSDNVDKSSDLASFISQKLRSSGTSACAVKQAGFVVLKSLAMPSVLVEVGFLTNSDDVGRLGKSSYRTQYAAAVADAIDSYFDRYAPVVSSPSGEHRVAPGETLWSIARRYGLSVGELRELNGLSEDATIHVDQILAVVRS
ncbi:MAG: N-acetylmuramoyl-L-alanine amidase [Candidatus Eisenbacteria bacterium]